MQYYTEKNKLILTEYGRNIQQMVEYAMTIEDRAERTHCVRTIINIMGNLFPHLRDVEDFKHKLWDHLAMMSDYKLDIDYPYEVPTRLVRTRPDKIPYPTTQIRYRYYGQHLPRFIQAATVYQGEDKGHLIELLANHTKKSFLTWNKDTVADSKILEDLSTLSGGVFRFSESQLHLRDSREFIADLKNKNKPFLNTGKNKQKNHNKH